jgi:hypothetical protein
VAGCASALESLPFLSPLDGGKLKGSSSLRKAAVLKRCRAASTPFYFVAIFRLFARPMLAAAPTKSHMHGVLGMRLADELRMHASSTNSTEILGSEF